MKYIVAGFRIGVTASVAFGTFVTLNAIIGAFAKAATKALKKKTEELEKKQKESYGDCETGSPWAADDDVLK